LILAGALAGAGVAEAPFNHSWREFPQVSNSGFTEASGDRAMQLSIEVPAPAHEVFLAFTTSEGFSSWAVPVALVDFRIGGYIEASYDPAAKPGDPNNIRNRILAYVPDRVLVIKNEQAPKGFADPELFQRTSTVIGLAGAGGAAESPGSFQEGAGQALNSGRTLAVGRR
jgi:uncharacterized protein YndB with AHSA1/START domain